MSLPGPKTPFTLQAPTQTRTTTSGVKNSWATVTTFNAWLTPINTAEVNAFDKETEIYTHLAMIGYEEIGDSYVTSLIPKNRIVADNSGNQLADETFDIIGVEAERLWNNQIHHFEVMLRKVL